MDIFSHNRDAWDARVEQNNRWTIPVDQQTIEQARRGEWRIVLTPTKHVPRSWFPELAGRSVLCLACGGGQQGPVLAAAGANVVVVDAAPKQLEQDRYVARRDNLPLTTIEGDMADLSMLASDTFDLVFHPCSNCFAPAVRPVWKECHRVLRSSGQLLVGFVNPVRYLFEDERRENGNLRVCHRLPYSDLNSLTDAERKELVFDRGVPLEFSHTLEDQIAGQLEAGFMITGFYEDRYAEQIGDPISEFMATFIATRAIKPE